MAKLTAPVGGTGLQIEDLAPAGQHVAVCLRINDTFQVERTKFQSQEKELRDVTRFVFGLKDAAGRLFLVQTFEFMISGAPGSNLVAFLTAWLGRNPDMGWDYAELLNRGAMITIQHKSAKRNPGQTYADISGIAPVHPQLVAMVPSPAEFAALLATVEAPQNGAGQPARPQAAAAPAPGRFAPPAAAPAPAANNAGRLTPPAPGGAPEFYVNNRGTVEKITLAELNEAAAQGAGAMPACKVGEQVWRTVNDYVRVAPAAIAPPPAPPAPPAGTPAPGPGRGRFAPPPGAPGPDEDVPF